MIWWNDVIMWLWLMPELLRSSAVLCALFVSLFVTFRSWDLGISRHPKVHPSIHGLPLPIVWVDIVSSCREIQFGLGVDRNLCTLWTLWFALVVATCHYSLSLANAKVWRLGTSCARKQRLFVVTSRLYTRVWRAESGTGVSTLITLAQEYEWRRLSC